MVRFLFILGIFFIPFNGISGFSIMGELKHELAAYFFICAILVCFLSIMSLLIKKQNVSSLIHAHSLLPRIFIFTLFVILISGVFNFDSISSNLFRGRVAYEKYFSSMSVILFGFSLSALTYFVCEKDWRKSLILPISLSVLACAFFSIFEVLNWYGYANYAYGFLRNIFHGGFNSPFNSWNGQLDLRLVEEWDKRLRSLAFEPPAFGNYSGFAWIWVLSGFYLSIGVARFFYLTAFVLLNVMIVLCASRTGYVMLAGNVCVLLALRYIFMPPKNVPPKTQRFFELNQQKITFSSINWFPWIMIFLSASALMCLAVYVSFNALRADIIAGDSASNISRLASQIAAFSMFADNPFFGTGFGQFGFNVAKHLPYWAFYSSEILPWLTFPDAPWPSVYSLYARLAAETGVLGFVGWIVLWLWGFVSVINLSRLHQAVFGGVPQIAYPLCVSCMAVLTSAIATDTFRTPMIWITLGLVCHYVIEMKNKLGQASMKQTHQNNMKQTHQSHSEDILP